ncbi:MAG: N-acetylmuramoyl-L-alanine amidase [Lentisphaeria bacterium]|nr:N-acetylmuramoyl-L-alanine amidase [Lentisphaeria bacterium]
MNRIAATLALLALLCPVHFLTAATTYIRQQKYTDAATVAARYRLRSTPSSGTLVMSDRTRQITFYPDKRDFRINNIKHHLSFPVAKQRGIYYISETDCQTILEPLLKPSALPRYRILNIVIDPGHGGHDNGAAGKKLREKDLTLQIARKVKQKLSAFGYRVSLTRDKDTYLTLPRRTEIARQRQADLFLSIHINAAANTTVSGIECFAITPAGAPSTGSQTVENRKYPGNTFGPNSLALADQIHRQLLSRTKAVDRGVKCARFQVLREINCPGSLIEVGFISNRQEEIRMGQADYQDKLARAICDAVVAYSKLPGRPQTTVRKTTTSQTGTGSSSAKTKPRTSYKYIKR